MAAPYIHAQSSARKFGGKPEDYIEIHSLLDSSKQVLCDSRHRALTHNSWFIINIIPKIFGHTAVNSDGKNYVPKDVAEQHVLEDFAMKFIPSAQDWLENLSLKDWMNNGKGHPPKSCDGLYKEKKITIEPLEKKEEHDNGPICPIIDEKRIWPTTIIPSYPRPSITD